MNRHLLVLLTFILCMTTHHALASNDTWLCEKCGFENELNFCGLCGAEKPSWHCYGCSHENTLEFCIKCGMHKAYSKGRFALDKGEYEMAAECFHATSYGDSKFQLFETYYAGGEYSFKQGDYSQALLIFENASDVYWQIKADTISVDSKNIRRLDDQFYTMQGYLSKCYSVLALIAENADDLDLAKDHYFKSFNITDTYINPKQPSQNKLKQEYYERGLILMRIHEYSKAAQCFEEASDYLDSPKQLIEAQKAVLTNYGIEGHLWIINDVEREIIMSKGDVGYICDLRANDVYVPVLELNNCSSDVDLDVYVLLNGEAYPLSGSFGGKDRSYYISDPVHVEGYNECVWYLNGIEVLKYTYEINTTK